MKTDSRETMLYDGLIRVLDEQTRLTNEIADLLKAVNEHMRRELESMSDNDPCPHCGGTGEEYDGENWHVCRCQGGKK